MRFQDMSHSKVHFCRRSDHAWKGVTVWFRCAVGEVALQHALIGRSS